MPTKTFYLGGNFDDAWYTENKVGEWPEVDDTCKRTYSTFRAGHTAGSYEHAGFRFIVDLDLDRVEIVSARLKYKAASACSGTVDVTGTCDDVDDSAEFGPATCDPSSRTPTSASVDWPSVDQIGGQWYYTPDLKAPMLEVMQRSGWTPGNHVTFCLSCDSGSEGAYFDGYQYDYNPSSAVRLEVIYKQKHFTGCVI